MKAFIIRSLKYLAVLACLAGLAAGAAMLIQKRKAAQDDAPRYGLAPMPVHGAVTRRGALTQTLNYLAIVEPVYSATLTARLTAQVDAVTVDEGDEVRAGQALARLDVREIDSALGAAQARIAQAEAELAAQQATVAALEKSADYWLREAERMKSLRSSDVVASSQAEAAMEKADQTTGQLNAARLQSQALRQQIQALHGQVSELRVRKSYGEIASPFDGLVSRRLVDPGDQAAPGKALLRIEDRSQLKLAFDVPQRETPQVQPGMTVSFVGPDGARSTTVSRVFPSMNAARMTRVEVDLDGDAARKLRSGSYLPVSVTIETLNDVTLAPTSALIESPGGKSHVFVVNDGTTRPAPVTVLGHSGEETAIDGIEPGTVVITSAFLGWSRLSEGLPVEVME